VGFGVPEGERLCVTYACVQKAAGPPSLPSHSQLATRTDLETVLEVSAKESAAARIEQAAEQDRRVSWACNTRLP